jgi:hypothetical protein
MKENNALYPIAYFYKSPDDGIYLTCICREPGRYEEYWNGKAFSYKDDSFDDPEEAFYLNQPSSQSDAKFFIFKNVTDEQILSLLSRMNPPMDKAVVKSWEPGL